MNNFLTLDPQLNRRLSVLLSFALPFTYIIGVYLIDWTKDPDPIAHHIYHYIMIPFSLFIAIVALLLTFVKREKKVVNWVRFCVNICMLAIFGLWFVAYLY